MLLPWSSRKYELMATVGTIEYFLKHTNWLVNIPIAFIVSHLIIRKCRKRLQAW